jgi:hypothetical protein
MSRWRSIAGEVVQLVPIISFALPFITAGGVDLAAAGGQLRIGTALGVPLCLLLPLLRVPLNPIAVASVGWMGAGALAFALSVPAQEGFAELGATGLFACATFATIAGEARRQGGALAWPGPETPYGPLLIVACMLAMGWAWYAADVRLGGGLPFIAVNVIRRVLLARAARGPQRET